MAVTSCLSTIHRTSAVNDRPGVNRYDMSVPSAAPDRSSWLRLRRGGDDAAARANRFVDACLEHGDEPFGEWRRVPAGPERVAPLPIAQPRQQRACPRGIVWRDAFVEEILMQAVIVEREEAAGAAGDERRFAEQRRIAAHRRQASGFAERRPEIADDEPRHGDVALTELIQRVVRVLQVRAVEDQQD